MKVSLNSFAKVLSTKPVSIKSISVYNPNDIYACVELHDQSDEQYSTPYKSIEAPPQSCLKIGANSGLVLSFSLGLVAKSSISLPEDLTLDFN